MPKINFMSSFEDFGLNAKLVSAVKKRGFENPTPIQEKVIPQLLSSEKDIIGLAQTGTGKTASFGIPLLMRLDLSNRDTQALVLSPTRELCL